MPDAVPDDGPADDFNPEASIFAAASAAKLVLTIGVPAGGADLVFAVFFGAAGFAAFSVDSVFFALAIKNPGRQNDPDELYIT